MRKKPTKSTRHPKKINEDFFNQKKAFSHIEELVKEFSFFRELQPTCVNEVRIQNDLG